MHTVRVALVEDDDPMRERLARVIQATPALQLVHQAADGAGLLRWFANGRADVLLADLGLPDVSGFDLIRQCRALQPWCAVMVITMFGDEASMLSAFEAGASGYLLKDGTEADLARHVMQLHSGGSPMSPVIARQLLGHWRAQSQALPARPAVEATVSLPALTERLSPRELDVLNLIARGFSYAEVGEKLGVSVATVQTHVRHLYGKLDVHSKTEAVFEARHLGLLK